MEDDNVLLDVAVVGDDDADEKDDQEAKDKSKDS